MLDVVAELGSFVGPEEDHQCVWSYGCARSEKILSGGADEEVLEGCC